ncbi:MULTISPECIES: multicopper oxidase domain-containing protein [unclassified Dietzia]|uniref:multicopper oxidase domain-containing protein n=1 Tax=unclassified Dietzia TaxID=2617939 RepID=UPI0015FA075B|nr:multicopper oxidase family protein [Dietzia sp. Cai40]MBB1045916.1 multicopper oxidase family protein [Dietzia sp. DQ11-44]
MSELTRRSFLLGSALAGAGALVACSGAGPPTGTPVQPLSDAVRRAELARRSAGQRVVSARLTPRPVDVDLGGRVVSTWGYDPSLPGPLLRARVGDLLKVEVDNQLPAETSVHWHGLALSNDMDGAPGLTQDPIAPGGRFAYEFTVPHAGTYFYHSHSGLQLDRGLYGPLIVDDPNEPGDHEHEWIVVLDDWLDGTGRTPDDVARDLGIGDAAGMGSGSGMGRMGAMDHGGMRGMGATDTGSETMLSPMLGGAGDVSYPLYLVNGRVPEDPMVFNATPGERARIRLINAGADTAFRVALGGHRMTITHTDGFPVVPQDTDALMVGMGERFDVLVTLGDGVFPLFAQAEGKTGHGQALVRTAAGDLPTRSRPDELDRQVLFGTDLAPRADVRLEEKGHDVYHSLDMGGTMSPYRWTLNGRAHPDITSLDVNEGQRVRMRMRNMSDMFHPMHLHGHTFALPDTGLRKDTVTIRPMRTVEIEFDADNPGQWALHCHNAYHQEAGMMTTLSYLA